VDPQRPYQQAQLNKPNKKGITKMKLTNAITVTTYRNEFTGYWFVGLSRREKPSVSTVRRHIRKSKAAGCHSVTVIKVEGIRHELMDRGNGIELVPVGY
jgi:hypothetical protein